MDLLQTPFSHTQSKRNSELRLWEIMFEKPILDTKLDKAIGCLVIEFAI